ncbi:MAG: NifU family protein, partial [Acidimicrobiia bacterium]
SPVAEQVQHVITHQINPAVASHGGQVELVAVEDGIAYVRLGGACQGCGMADVTLSQGIESTILAAVEEVHTVIDVTDHNSGENPYYEPSKK